MKQWLYWSNDCIAKDSGDFESIWKENGSKNFTSSLRKKLIGQKGIWQV